MLVLRVLLKRHLALEVIAALIAIPRLRVLVALGRIVTVRLQCLLGGECAATLLAVEHGLARVNHRSMIMQRSFGAETILALVALMTLHSWGAVRFVDVLEESLGRLKRLLALFAEDLEVVTRRIARALEVRVETVVSTVAQSVMPSVVNTVRAIGAVIGRNALEALYKLWLGRLTIMIKTYSSRLTRGCPSRQMQVSLLSLAALIADERKYLKDED